jgi:hypothetical protein
MAEDKLEETHFAQVPLEWYVPEDLVSRYATNLVVQHSEHEFVISFFEIHPPLLLGTPEEIEAKLKQIESVQAHCVARIIVAAERMPEFLQVLQHNLDRYFARKELEQTPE